MITHSSILAWRVPWTEEPSGLRSMGSQRVRITHRGGSSCPVVSRGRGDGPQAANKKPLGRTEAWHLCFPTTTLKDAVWYQDPRSSELLIALRSEFGCKGKRKEGGRKKGKKKKMEGTKERMGRRKRRGKKGGRKTENTNRFIIAQTSQFTVEV